MRAVKMSATCYSISVGGGITYPISLPEKFKLLPFAAFGFSGGRLNYQGGYSFFEAGLDLGATAEYLLNERWRLATALSFRYLFDKFVPGSFLQFNFGLGYVFEKLV
jgi:hypothetical protein